MLENLTTLTGVVKALKPTEGGCQFTLLSKGNAFFVKAAGPIFCNTLQEALEIYAVLIPRSFRAKCGSHHVYFEAVAIIPVVESALFRRLAGELSALIVREHGSSG
ncbi:MAG: hypothetical protein HS114_24550 [Anaerolineales bacterium]|nr:hypothetical protein [Anaerolineales bacterium]